jgi:hypothetical protein
MLVFLMLLIFSNFASAGPGQPVAVVSTLSGEVTVARAGRSIPLKFKDEAFPDDIIRTADQSVVRLLLREKALMSVQQRSVLTLGEEQGNLTVKLETGKIGVSVADRRLRPGEALQIETPNVQAALGRGNVIVNTGKISSGVQTIVYVMDGSIDISLRGTATRRSVKIEAPRKLTVVGEALGNTQALSAAESTKLLAELRATSPQHLNAPPPEIERVIVRHGRDEAAKQAKLVAKQAKLVAKQVKQAGGAGQGRSETGTDLTAEKGTGRESGSKAGLDANGKDVGAGGVSTVDNKVGVSTGSGGHSSSGTAVSTVDNKIGVTTGGGGHSIKGAASAGFEKSVVQKEQVLITPRPSAVPRANPQQVLTPPPTGAQQGASKVAK